MTIPAQIPVTSSVANGVTTSFPYTFKILSADDLTVTVDGEIVMTGYSVLGVGNDSGGLVEFDTAPANGLKVVRYIDPTLARTIDYQQFGDWLADIVNADFDRIWLTIQAITQSQLISIKLPIDTTTEQIINEDAAARAGKLLGFDNDGDVVAKDPTELVPDLNDAVQDAIDAAASANSSANIAVAAATAAATTPVAAPTHAATSKTIPVDADELPLIDSGASFGLKRLTWANLKATLKTYFDTLYSLVVVNATNDPTFSSTSSTDAVSPEWLNGKLSGITFDWPGASAPPGAIALPLVPTNVSRTTYSRWFARFGTQWGVGDGSTTMGMPYCPENFAIIQANGNVGSQSTGQMPSHSHTVSIYGGAGGGAGLIPVATGSTLSGSANTNAAGTGSNNLAAGVRMLKCIWL